MGDPKAAIASSDKESLTAASRLPCQPPLSLTEALQPRGFGVNGMTLGEVIRRGLSAFCCRPRDRLWLLRLPELGFGTLEDGTAVVKNAEVVMCRSLKRLSTSASNA